MILSDIVLSNIRTELNSLNITNYYALAPQDAPSPCCTFVDITTIESESTFETIMEDIHVQFMVTSEVDASGNCSMEDLRSMMSKIESKFEHYTKNDGSSNIICTHLKNESGIKFNKSEGYYFITRDISFKCNRNKIR